ncbi:MAG: hypothetical protein QOK39_559 [Acidimicrobiaceae bacterium]|nr:hypothetical protein [Acidimicrobiaceae bacterium]
MQPTSRPAAARPPAGPDRFLIGVAVVIVALLAAGGAAVAIHKDKSTTTDTVTAPPAAGTSGASTTTVAPHATTTTTTLVTPAGYQRLTDTIDHVSLAVPPGWVAPDVSNTTLANALKALRTKNPTLAPVIDPAITALTKIQIGVFAADVTTRSSLYAYGIDLPNVTSADQVPPANVAKQIQAAGGKNVHAAQIHLPVGPAGQVTAQFVVDGVTISQALDYFVIQGRLVSLIVATRGTTAPLTALRQIEPTLGAA